MSTTTSTSSSVTASADSSMVMMTPYLHFTGGDFLFFKTWTPSSKGAIAGACIGLLFLTLLERALSALRGALEMRWNRSALAFAAGKPELDGMEDLPSEDGKTTPTRPRRSFAPFVPAHDVTRGAIHTLQSLLGFALMLAVMTFNAAYIITIILGLGIGEIAFGRFRTVGMQGLR